MGCLKSNGSTSASLRVNLLSARPHLRDSLRRVVVVLSVYLSALSENPLLTIPHGRENTRWRQYGLAGRGHSVVGFIQRVGPSLQLHGLANPPSCPDFYERMHFLNYHLGIQSNIIVAASYNNDLTKPAVYAALRTVVACHPGLANVGEMVPSKKKGRHILRRVLLHTVNLDSCVEFVEQEGLGIDAQFIENVHNKEWNWTTVEPGRPWWKLIVVNRRHAAFVFHHMICDGAFGSMFHRDLLAALNSLPEDQQDSDPDPIIRLDPATVKLSADPRHLTDTKPSILRAIYNVLFTYFVHYCLGSRVFFSDLPRPKPFSTSLLSPEPAQRTVSRVSQLRIPADKMALILAACRAHETTFTPLLIVTMIMVLAADYYPQATASFTRTAIDMRPLLRPSPNGTAIVDGAGGLYRLQRLRAYRTAIATGDPELAWRLVRAYGGGIRRGLAQTSNLRPHSAALPDWHSGNLLGAELEDVLDQAFPVLGIAMNHSFMVSNIGACPGAPPGGDVAPPWQLVDMQFSAGAVNRNFGAELVCDAAGVKGRDTVVNAVYTDGTFTRERIESILSAVMSRLDALCQEQ